MKRKDLVQFLEGAKKNRLTNVELDDFLDLYGDEEFSLKFHFISRSLSFGNQKDPKYNDGHAVICNVDGLDVECSLLFTVDEKDQAEALESGNVFNSKVHVLDYDSLYQRIIFGNKGPLEALDPFYANQSKSDEKVVPENNADRADLIEESQVGAQQLRANGLFPKQIVEKGRGKLKATKGKKRGGGRSRSKKGDTEDEKVGSSGCPLVMGVASLLPSTLFFPVRIC